MMHQPAVPSQVVPQTSEQNSHYQQQQQQGMTYQPPAADRTPQPVPSPTQQTQPYAVAPDSSSDGIRSLRIGDLQQWMDENYLVGIFAHTGEVISAKVIRNKQTNFPEGYGLIEFVSHAAAERVLQSSNGTQMPNTEQNFRLSWASYGAGESCPAMLDDGDESEVEVEQTPKLVFKANLEAKLKELLHNINSIEIKLCSHATKEFIKLLKAESGGELLWLYVHTSNRFSELLDAWKLRQGKPGMSYVFSLISAILNHPEGMYKPNDKERVVTSRLVDKFARMIIDDKMDDVYKEIDSKEGKRQSAALLMMASIISRGSGLASEVAKIFDFKLPGFAKLSEYKQKGNDKQKRNSTRKSFVRFAMSFLEVGKPGLLRWVLQQKEMFSGVLRGLGNDEDEIVIYVLSTLQNRVLTQESLVPPGLRSVLFGSVTLEQLVSISGRENSGAAAELAHHVLVMVCTDPCNGLMPDLRRHPNPLRGNPKRLLGLMKKLKATEISYHRDLLLEILRGRPSLGSFYMDEFPYNLEDYASTTWIANVSLAANLISSVGTGLSFDFLDTQSHNPPLLNNADVQSVLNCICPRPFSRTVLNKGLLHSDFLVKHGTLRLLLELLKLLDSFIGALCSRSCSSKRMKPSCASLSQEIQNEVRTLLPDPQVLLTLFSLQSSRNRPSESHLKRKLESSHLLECSNKNMKKTKTDVVDEDMDIIIGGIGSDPQINLPKHSERTVNSLITDELDTEKDFMNVISEIWGLDLTAKPAGLNDAEVLFLSKLLEALGIYLRTMPHVLEGSFDFFANLLNDPLALTTNLLCPLLSLLTEYIEWSTKNGVPVRTPPLMYKHLQPFVNLSIFSPINEIRDQAYNLARAAMLSTGAFDRNVYEVGAWFLFLPGYSRNNSIEEEGLAVLQRLSRVVISFLCDAVSTVGNNLFKYWAIVLQYTDRLKSSKGVSPGFSPLIVCVLQKCLRILNSESGTFSLPEKSMISLYVSSTLKYILQTQVDVVSLSALIESNMSEGLVDRCSVDDDSGDFFCEWRPLKNLLLFSQCISHQKTCCMFSVDKNLAPADSSFTNILNEVKKIVSGGHNIEIAGTITAFSSAMLCATPDDLLKNFPSVMTITQNLLGVPVSLLSSIVFHEPSFLPTVSRLWPGIFFSGLEMAVALLHREFRKDNACGTASHSLLDEEMPYNIDIDATENADGAFSFFLKQAPFHVLLPAIMKVDVPYSLEPSKIQDLLLAKLSEQTTDYLISYLRLLLFWLYQIRSAYLIEPVSELQWPAEICSVLIKHVFAQLLVSKPDSVYSTNVRFHLSSMIFREVAETVFCHPVVSAFLSFPLCCNEEGKLRHNLETLLLVSRKKVHKIDHHILDVLTSTSEYLLSLCSGQHSVLESSVSKPLVKVLSALVQRLFLEFRDKFEVCIVTEDVSPLLPKFYALHALMRFISPFEVLELVHWIFSRLDVKEPSICKSFHEFVLSIGFCIAGGAFEALSNYLQQPITKRVTYDILWELEEKTFNINRIEEIYIQMCKFAVTFNFDTADICLLKAIKAIYNQNYLQHYNLHPLSLVISRVVMRTPTTMISHFVYRTSMTKAELLFLVTKMSSLHLSVFGEFLLGILNKDSLLSDTLMGAHGYTLSDEDFVRLLPATLLCLDSNFVKFEKQYHKKISEILSTYSMMLLNGFRDWESFVSRSVFQEEYDEFLPSSAEEVLNLVDDSRLGKAIKLLRYQFALSGDLLKTKKLLKLFNSIFPCSSTHDGLLDCDLKEMKFDSVNQSLNLINRVVTRVSLCRMMLFPEENLIPSLPKEADGGPKEISLKSGSDEQMKSRMRFLNILVDTWQWMVKKLPTASDGSMKNKSRDCLSLYRYLEVFILRSILGLTMKMLDALIDLQSIPFLEQLMRSALFYRFEDLTTLKMLQSILTSLLEAKFSRVLYLQLLLAHSRFAFAIQSVHVSSNAGTGVFLRPMSGILRLIAIPHPNPNVIEGKNDQETTGLPVYQLEILKLLRALLIRPHLCGSDFGKNSDINLRELLLLLLSSYGATLSDIDLEIYHIMHEIELISESNNDIAQLDYLWGTAAVKVRKELALEQDTFWNFMTNTEAVAERRRNQFRENLPVDPKICAITVLHFPYDRIVCDEPSSSNKLQPDNLKNFCKMHSPDIQNIQRYDPVFILRFSIHSLSMGFIEPVEFAGLGLLAVAFVSISSPDVGMRKLGYETLGRFKNALEKCQTKKDIIRLRLLMTYIQNGINEPWQRIPSVIAMFAAETSLLLLDPSHDHYATLSKLLMHSSRVNMKSVPFFHDFFSSGSVNFRAERLWILRLMYAGLNLDDDAQIYIRNSIIEILLSFYASPLADNESKELILLIVKKSVKLYKLACYLVEHCGLISWLSSLLSIFSGMLLGDEKGYYVNQLDVVVEVVNDVISSRNIIEWLQRHALEQLIELSSHLFKLLSGGTKLMRENFSLVKSVLQAVNVYDTARYSASAELGLKAILMSTPPFDIFHVNRRKLSSFLMWAISTAMKSDSGQMHQPRGSHLHLTNVSEDAPFEESLTSKLLRWLIASVILGKLSWRLDPDSKLSNRSHKTLQTLLENVEKACEGINKSRNECEDILGAAIFYLQQLAGMHCAVLSSVVAALSLLLYDASECTGSSLKLGHMPSVVSLWSRIRCPAEANPTWRWSFYQPWKDHSSEVTDLQEMDELKASQSLLEILSNVLGKKSLNSEALLCKDVAISGV